MFRKEPDNDLFARVFDEGAPGDTRMEWLRDGLKDLREVPPHGLSNERLRDRVLGTGLSPARSASVPWWTWVWAPVAAAAIAVVLLPRLRPNPTPNVILDGSTVAIGGPAIREPRAPALSPDRVAIRVPTATDDFDLNAALAAAARLPDVAAPNTPFVAPRASRSRSVVRKTSRRPIGPAFRATVTSLPSFGTGAPEKPRPAVPTPPIERGGSPGRMAFSSQSDATRDAAREMATLVAERSDPLVVLAPEIDSATGAASATEVDSPANLSIGG